MDSKKTNLTPELKEIYDRVMNTSGAKPAAPATPAPAAPPATPDPAPAPSALPPTPPVAGAPTEAAAASAIPSMPSIPDPTPPPTAAEEALTATPARPLTEGNTFAFNGNTKDVPTSPAAKTPTEVAKPAGKKKISTPILIVLGLAFIGVWGFFWAIILGIIKL